MVSVPLQHARKVFNAQIHENKRSRDLESISVSIPMLSVRQDMPGVGINQYPIHSFRFHDWIWSAHFDSNSTSNFDACRFYLALNVVHRERSNHPGHDFEDEAFYMNDVYAYHTVMSAAGQHFGIHFREVPRAAWSDSRNNLRTGDLQKTLKKSELKHGKQSMLVLIEIDVHKSRKYQKEGSE